MNRAYLLTRRSLKSALNQGVFSFNVWGNKDSKNGHYSTDVALKLGGKEKIDYEVIVVDDAGTDDTEQVMNLYMKRHKNLSYYKLSQNRGLSFARNYGIMKAQGKYVVCLDDDNELLPNFLEETIRYLDVVNSFFIPSTIDLIRDVVAVAVGRIIKYKDFEDYAPPINSRFPAIDWGWLIRKEVFDEIQYDENLRANEDTDFGIRFSKKYSWIVIDKPLTIAFDMEDPKQSLSFPTQRELDGITYFLKKNLHEYKGYPNEKRCLYRLAGRKFYRGGYRLKGLGYFVKSFLVCPNLNSFANLFFILFGWWAYDKFMTFTEKVGARKRMKASGKRI